MQTISDVNSVNRWSTQLSEIKPCSIHSLFHPNQEQKRSHNKFTLCKISCFAPQGQVDFKTSTRWMCVSCPVNRCTSRNIPCKRRKHILLDRQSSLFVLNQLHCKIIQSLCCTQCWRNTHAHRETRRYWYSITFCRGPKRVQTLVKRTCISQRNQSHNGQRRMWSGNLKHPN